MALTSKTFSSLITFTRASSGTRVNASGLIETVSSNVPRFDYDPVTLAPKGLLIEEQRTNRVLQSEDFTVSPWAAAVSGTSTRTNEAGTKGFVVGVITATSANGGIRQVLTGLTSTQVYALSFYLESATPSVQLQLENSAAAYGTACQVNITPSTGATSALLGFTSVTSYAWGAGRVYTVILPAAGGSLIANLEWRIPTSGDTIRIGRPQFEAGPFATSYIPTTSAQVTRAADVPTITGANFSDWFNQTEGTFVVEADVTDRASLPILLGSHSSATRGFLFVKNNGNIGSWNGTNELATTGGAITANTRFKAAMGYSAAGRKLCLNGGTVASDANSVGTVDGVFLGKYGSTASQMMTGHFARVTYYPALLSNAQFQALTA